MKQIIEYFDRSYIINLADRTDRRRQVEREFRSVDINIPNERIQFYTAVRPTDKAGFIDIGTRGNFDSHRRVLELANKDRLRNVLIFEDDVCFRNVGESFKDQLISQLAHEEWDVVCFGYIFPIDDGLTGPLMRWQKDFLGAQVYAVNGRFIPIMLQYMNDCEFRLHGDPYGCPMPADGIYNQARRVLPNVRLFLSVPNLAHQRSSRTDIAQTHVLDRIAGLKSIMLVVRAIKHRIRMAQDKKKLGRQLGRQ
jgi:glycosyl transferase, family 25